MVRPMTPLLADLLATHAPPTRAPFVPELTLHFARDLIPIWEALDAYLGSPPSGSAAPFWAVPWVGGQVVARHLLDHPEVVQGKKVLDFGAGSGIGTLAALRAGAAQVVATEIDPIAVEALQANLALNGLAGRPEVLVVDTDTWQETARIPVLGQPVFGMARPDGRQGWVNFSVPD